MKRREDLALINNEMFDQFGNHIWTESVWYEIETPQDYFPTREVYAGEELWACPPGKKTATPMEHFPKFNDDEGNSIFGVFNDSRMAFDQWNHEIEESKKSQTLFGY